MNEAFTVHRTTVFDEVIRKLNGPKKLIGSYFTNYKRIGNEWDRRHSMRWEYYNDDFYDDGFDDNWQDHSDELFMNRYNTY